MATKAQKVRVGIFTAVTGLLVALVIVTFGGLRFWEKHDEYRIVFDDTVMGLESGSLVYLNGIKVGSVKRIEVAPEDLRKVMVTIEIKGDAQVKEDTQAMLQYAGITGLRVIDLRGGTYAAARLAPGSVIKTGQTTLDKLEARATEIVDQTQQVMAKANEVVSNLAAITDPKQFEGIKDIIGNARVASENLVETSAVVKAMAAENRVAIRETIGTVQTTVAQVGASAERATGVFETEVTALVRNANDAVAGVKGLVTSNQGLLRSALYDLRQASRSFKELSREVRQQPSRLFFGDAPKERKLPR